MYKYLEHPFNNISISDKNGFKKIFYSMNFSLFWIKANIRTSADFTVLPPSEIVVLPKPVLHDLVIVLHKDHFMSNT